ncbi:MAG: winged-helix domain-containing protein [Bacteroidales bacterium]|nr:winged-helix domain-containing protein [Bacteroidales bacterium]
MHSNGNVLLWCKSTILRRTIRNYLLDNAYTAIVCNRPEEIGMALSIDDFLLLISDAPYPDTDLDSQLARETQLTVLHITGQWPEVPPPPHRIHIAPPFDLDLIGQCLQQQKKPAEPTHFTIGKYEVFPSEHCIRYRNRETNLPKKEMELLLLLYKKRPYTLSKEAIQRKLWPTATDGKDNSIHVYINNLRKYLAEDDAIRLLSVYGKGFRLECQ